MRVMVRLRGKGDVRHWYDEGWYLVRAGGVKRKKGREGERGGGCAVFFVGAGERGL